MLDAAGRLRNMASEYARSGGTDLLRYPIGSKVIGQSYVGTGGGHFAPGAWNGARARAQRELE